MLSFLSRIAMLCAGMLWVSACSAPVEVRLHPGADFTRYRTWDWLSGDALVVHAPDPDAGSAELRLTRAITQTLRRSGFERVRESPDLYVGVVLAIRPQLQVVRRTGAMQSVWTFDQGAAWEVQSAETDVKRFDHLRLEVYVIDTRSGQLVWEARLTERVEGLAVERLDESVEALFAEFPSPHVLGRGQVERRFRAG